MTRHPKATAWLLLLGCLTQPATAARQRAPGFLEQALSLPGIPAAMLPADMDGDGRDDLVVLVAYTGWSSRAEFEQARFDDIEGLVEVMNVVDELVDRRELRVYGGAADGQGVGAQLAALDLDTSVHALATGHPGEPLIALTDEGVAAVRLVEGQSGPQLTLTPLLTGQSSLSGSGRFYPNLELLHDLDGDGLPELLLPTATGWVVHAGVTDGFAATPAAAIVLPPPPVEEDSDEEGEEVEPRLPHELRFELADLDADGRLDFVLPHGVAGSGPLVYRKHQRLSFAEVVELSLGDADEKTSEVIFVGHLDGDPEAELVRQTELERYEDPGWRQEVDEAKRPLFSYAVHGLDPGLVVEPDPRQTFRAIGYTFGGSESEEDEVEVQLPAGFQDLDGNGRRDLVAITLDFSLVPLVMQVLVTRRVSLTMNFHVFCQTDEGAFREVPGLDLAGKFKLNLKNLKILHLSQFAGDFDGDGRADFVQLGRGKRVTMHLGRAQCVYPRQPDRAIRLRRKLRHLGLARILDLDGDGRSDLYVVHPLETKDKEVSIPVRVDLYLSRF